MLDYYYGKEAEQFSFYRVPKLLFTEEYKEMSLGAKLLYGLLLDRMDLSIKNKWIDEKNRVYIYYTLEEVMEITKYGHTKVVSMFSELQQTGLIDRKKQGQGKPVRIYLKNLATISDFRKVEVKTSEKWKPRLPENGSLDFRKTEGNHTDMSHTDMSHTEREDPSYLPTDQYMVGRDGMELFSWLVKRNINYDSLKKQLGHDSVYVDELLRIMLDAFEGQDSTIKVNGQNVPKETVRKRFLEIRAEHILYVIDYLKDNRKQIKNIKAYVVTCLYNAPATVNVYYTNRGNCDVKS